MVSHKKQRARDGRGGRMIIKCVWGPHNIATGEDAEWLLENHNAELGAYVERLKYSRPQAFRGLLRNVDGLLDRLARRGGEK